MKKRFLSTLLALCMMLALLPGTARAATIQSGSCGDKVSWSFSDSGVLTISGSGPMADYSYYGNVPWRSLINSITSVVVTGTVSNLSRYSFDACVNLTSATIAPSVKSIGYNAFWNCKNLKSIYYGGTVAQWNSISFDNSNNPYIFNSQCRIYYSGSPSTSTVSSGNCGDKVQWALDSSGRLTLSGSGPMWDYSYYGNIPWRAMVGSVTSAVITGSVSNLSRYTFDQCVNLTSVTIAPSVKSMGYNTFYNCKNLRSIYYGGTVAQWCDITFDNSNNPYLFTDQCRMYFSGSPSTTVVSAGNCGTDMSWTLDSGGKLTISGPGDMWDYSYYGNIPWRAMVGSITSAVITGTASSLSRYTFDQCVNLTSVMIPASVKSIGYNAFYNCKNLRNVYYGGSSSQWSSVNVDKSNNGYLYSAECRFTYNYDIPVVKCTVTFDANGGTISAADRTRAVIQNSTYGALPMPTRSGYIFNGWYTAKSGGTAVYADTKVDSDHTVYAHWVADPNAAATMTVTFNANSGSVSTKTKTVTKGSTYGTLPTPTRSGYKFDGWYTSPSSGTKVTSATTVTKSGNHTLYAHWTANSSSTGTVKVTFNVNGGSALSTSNKTKNVTKGKTYGTLPTPTRSGFKFNGWYTKATGGTKVLSTTKVSTASSHTLYAHWAKKTYQVTFNPNGGTVLRDFNAVVNGSAYGSMPTPTYPGRHFLGWYTKATGGSKVTATTKVTLTGNKTLYAHWSTAAVTASTPKTVSKRVTIPAYYELALYSNTTTATPATYLQYTKDTPITCTRSTTLSNGTVRYYAKFGSSYYWFTYTDEMN